MLPVGGDSINNIDRNGLETFGPPLIGKGSWINPIIKPFHKYDGMDRLPFYGKFKACIKRGPYTHCKWYQNGGSNNYCRYGLKLITCGLDYAAVVATISGAGAPYGVAIKIFSAVHGYVAYRVCGEEITFSTVSTAAGVLYPAGSNNNVNMAISAIDAALTALSL